MRKDVPRWQQGFRPWAYGDVWDRMTPVQRRRAFLSDVAVAVAFVFIIYLVAGGI